MIQEDSILKLNLQRTKIANVDFLTLFIVDIQMS